jgi:midasin
MPMDGACVVLQVVGDTILPMRVPPQSVVNDSTGTQSQMEVQVQDSIACFVPTMACQDSLRAMAMAMVVGKPVILEGPPGTGKTALLDELARRCGQFDSMIRVHLDDQLDSKILLGSYICTEEPGQFKWQPGALTQAVRGGRWIVFEDLHCAPFELLAALKPLLEDRTLFVAGRGERVAAASGFQLFATQTIAASGASRSSSSGTGAMASFANLFTHVHVGLLPLDEMRQILTATFGVSIGCCIPPMLETIQLFNAVRLGPALGRFAFTLRDLLKWGRRVEQSVRGQSLPPSAEDAEGARPVELWPHSLRILVYQEAMDSFCSGWSKPAAVSKATELIRRVWKVDGRYLEQEERPQMVKTPLIFGIGRYQLDVKPPTSEKGGFGFGVDSMESSHSSGERFSETTHSLCVLQRVAACAKVRLDLICTKEAILVYLGLV